MALQLNDGCTFEATLGAMGRFPAVTIRYREALPAAVHVMNAAGRISGEAQAEAEAKFLADHLVGWDVEQKSASGYYEPAPVKIEQARKVPLPVRTGLVNIVAGYSEGEYTPKVAEGNFSARPA